MIYKKNLINVGRGRLSSITFYGNIARVVIKSGSRLEVKFMQPFSRQVYGARVVGYADDCFLLPHIRLDRLGEELICGKNTENVGAVTASKAHNA